MEQFGDDILIILSVGEDGEARGIWKGAEMSETHAGLAEEFEFYLNHQDELVKEYAGKYIVIKDRKVLGAYGSEAEAIRETTREHTLGTFIVQKCEAGNEAYTQVFHSRVAFV